MSRKNRSPQKRAGIPGRRGAPGKAKTSAGGQQGAAKPGQPVHLYLPGSHGSPATLAKHGKHCIVETPAKQGVPENRDIRVILGKHGSTESLGNPRSKGLAPVLHYYLACAGKPGKTRFDGDGRQHGSLALIRRVSFRKPI